MALVGFKARNHPQQQLFQGPRADVDERATPPEAFAVWHARFSFTVDAAALEYNAKLPRYWTPEDDGLKQDWTGERVWCNPPFSKIEPWVMKATSSHADLVVMLVPANRTEQDWWQFHVEPYRDRGDRLTVEFLRGRMRFGLGGNAPLPDTRAPFGCCLLIWSETLDRGLRGDRTWSRTSEGRRD
jgi:phage N-6-adenine-methyltransferase